MERRCGRCCSIIRRLLVPSYRYSKLEQREYEDRYSAIVTWQSHEAGKVKQSWTQLILAAHIIFACKICMSSPFYNAANAFIYNLSEFSNEKSAVKCSQSYNKRNFKKFNKFPEKQLIWLLFSFISRLTNFEYLSSFTTLLAEFCAYRAAI